LQTFLGVTSAYDRSRDIKMISPLIKHRIFLQLTKTAENNRTTLSVIASILNQKVTLMSFYSNYFCDDFKIVFARKITQFTKKPTI
jgi:hypothetical protein